MPTGHPLPKCMYCQKPLLSGKNWADYDVRENRKRCKPCKAERMREYNRKATQKRKEARANLALNKELFPDTSKRKEILDRFYTKEGEKKDEEPIDIRNKPEPKKKSKKQPKRELTPEERAEKDYEKSKKRRVIDPARVETLREYVADPKLRGHTLFVIISTIYTDKKITEPEKGWTVDEWCQAVLEDEYEMNTGLPTRYAQGKIRYVIRQINKKNRTLRIVSAPPWRNPDTERMEYRYYILTGDQWDKREKYKNSLINSITQSKKEEESILSESILERLSKADLLNRFYRKEE